MAGVLEKDRDHFSFRRTLWGDTLIQLNEIRQACLDISLNENKDSITWSLTSDEKITIKSFYNQLILN